MKKTLFLFMALATSVAGHAYDYPYLTFVSADGTTRSFAVESLTMNVAEKSLAVKNSAEEASLTLADLQKMYFSSEATAITQAAANGTRGTVDVFSIEGMRIGSFTSVAEARNALSSGIYVIKTNNKTQKIAVKAGSTN